MRATLLIALGAFLAGLPAVGLCDEWPQFRGVNGSATSSDKQTPVEWGTDKNVAWKAKLPGYGWSSPVIWGDKVFLTTAVSDKQRKPSSGGGGGGAGRPRSGQILNPFVQDLLKLTDQQKKELEPLQKEVDSRLAEILTDEQKKQLREPQRGPGRGPRGFPQPGQILPPALQEQLKLTDEQKKQAEDLQKRVDAGLEKILTDEQKKQIKDLPNALRRGGQRGRGAGRRPPDAVFKMEVFCLDRHTGKVLWKQLAYEGKPRIPAHSTNTYATETVVTDGTRVYAYFGMHGVYCYDFKGDLIWKTDLGSYPMAMGHGTGSSPTLDDGRLFIQCDNEDKSFLVALDAKTGKQLWRVDRPERTTFSTPLIWKNKIRTEVVCLGSSRVRSYDPATGKQLWELGGVGGQVKASPVADSELLYVGAGGAPGIRGRGGRGGQGGRDGGGRPLFAVKAGASGDITPKEGEKSNDGVAWHLSKAGPQTSSPLLYQGHIYVLEDRNAFLNCYDAQTGKEIYRERLPGARGFTSSPCACDNKIYCLDSAGTTFVIQAGAAFKLLGKNALDEMCWSSPAVVDGALFLRTVDHLYCIEPKGEKK